MLKLIKKVTHQIWSLFLGGLITLLPLTLTVAVFHTSFKILAGWLAPIRAYVPEQIANLVPYAEIIGVILVIFLFGIILRVFVLHTVVHAIEDIIIKIPLIRPIYSGIRQLIQAFSIQDKITFKQVVLVEFPHPGIHSVGFLTSELAPELTLNNPQKCYGVFIPTTPNPTSGFFVIVPESDVHIIDLTRQEAMAMIISGGIIQPERLNKKNI
jgi:uncharacterized membrane protein